jgi:hypothetical protein
LPNHAASKVIDPLDFARDPLDLIEADLVPPAIVELRRAIAAAFSSVPPFLM